MKQFTFNAMIVSGALFMASCVDAGNKDAKATDTKTGTDTKYEILAESFADLQLLRYQVPGWDQLTAQQKEFAYYLSEASLAGRDIIYDQQGKYNLAIRKLIENIYQNYTGKKEGTDWENFKTYAGQIWFSNGVYHHYSADKIMPAFSFEYFTELVNNSDQTQLPLKEGQDVAALLTQMKQVMFDPTYAPKKVNLSANTDNVAQSFNNFYEGVTAKEVDEFYAAIPHSDHEPEWGLNSKVVKEDGKVVEKVWKSGGMYGAAIDKIIFWLEKAMPISENEQQKKSIGLLIEYYKTGDLKKWDEYCIEWTKNTETIIDFTNGFIEVYGDAIGKKGSYESIVSIKDFESSKRIETIAKEAQWFEDNSPLMESHKKKNVKGINAKVINVVMEAGDASPSTPIGINLPNSDWIRKEHGSKSVSLGNIVSAYNESSAGSGMLDEFVIDDENKKRIKEFGNLSSDLHTDMHECIGHASGQINPGIGTPDKTLKSYASTLEEARADLVALYYVMDQKLVDIKVMPSLEVGRAEYYTYMMNGMMTQLVRLKEGAVLEEAHMRNRALNARWVFEKGQKDNVVELVKKDGKTFVQINDYEKLRVLFGDLLREIQRIKSEGDYEAGKALVENYGVKVDPVLHKEILERYAKLDVRPYKGFIQPRLVPIMDGDKIVDVKLEHGPSFFDQMIEYGNKYNFLPVYN